MSLTPEDLKRIQVAKESLKQNLKEIAPAPAPQTDEDDGLTAETAEQLPLPGMPEVEEPQQPSNVVPFAPPQKLRVDAFEALTQLREQEITQLSGPMERLKALNTAMGILRQVVVRCPAGEGSHEGCSVCHGQGFVQPKGVELVV